MTYTVQIQGRKLVNFIYSCCVYLSKAVNTIDGFTGRHRCVLSNNCSAKLFGFELKHDDFNEIFFKNYLQNICMHHYQKSNIVKWKKFWTGGQNMWVQVLAMPLKMGTSYL